MGSTNAPKAESTKQNKKMSPVEERKHFYFVYGFCMLINITTYVKGNKDAHPLEAKIRYVTVEYYSMNLGHIFIADPPKRERVICLS